MATARPSPTTTSSSSSSATVVHQLVELFRTNGHRVLHGDSKVCFTSDSLTLLNNYFQAAKFDIILPQTNDRVRTSSIPPLPPPPPSVQNLRINTRLREDLIFLHDFLKKIHAVKLIHHAGTLQGNVFLYPFQHVVCLELKKIPPHMVSGLSILRPQLETLICSQSVTKIEDLISDCGGDSVQPEKWPRLKSLFLAHNFIERIDQSLKYLIALEIVPHVKHLNLSSNQLRNVPIWPEYKGPCRLFTLKMRQNCLEDVTGIEIMKSIEELDLSDNFITLIPEQIRYMPTIKRLSFARNPFTYATNYRQQIIYNLPYVFSQEARELLIDDQQLTSKEKQRIPRNRNRQQPLVSAFRPYSPSSSAQNTTTSESTTEPESITSNSSGTVVVKRRGRPKNRPGNLRTLDADETPTEHATSGSDNETGSQRRRLKNLHETLQDIDGTNHTSQTPGSRNIYQSTIYEQDDNILKSPTSVASSIPRKLANDLSQSPKRRKSPRSRRADPPTRIVLEVVDVSNTTSDETPVPDSPISERNASINKNYQTPIPVLEPKENPVDEINTGDSIRTIFFITDQTSNDTNRSFTIEIDPMYLIEKDINDEDYSEKIKYSTIKLLNNNESNQKTVEFTFEKRRNEVERRIYSFDTKQDQKAFVEEIERHLELSVPIELPNGAPLFIECTKCGKYFPPLTSMNHTDNTSSAICMACQNAIVTPPIENFAALQLQTTMTVSSDQADLDHRLHLHVVTEHFTHNNEQIKLHFKCFVVRSTTSKYFIAQTILTDYGIYIFQHEALSTDFDSEYVLVGKDLLTNVLMLDIGYRLQTFTIELQSAAFAFLLADQQKTQTIVNHILEVLSPVVQSGEGALQKISRISSDEYRQRLFDIIKIECNIDEPNDDMIDFYSIMIRMDQAGNSQMIALLLLKNWILMIEDAYATIDSRHVRLPAQPSSESGTNLQLKCDLMHLVNVTNYINHAQLFVFDFVDESETKEFRWKLESLTTDSKNEFLTKVRDTYRTFMDIPMPEKFEMNKKIMCDLFQANPWKPLLCTNCHQNRSGHQIMENTCEHLSPKKSSDLPASTSSMHLYEEIMAQYFTINTTDIDSLKTTSVIERLPTPDENELIDDDDVEEDSFSDEEQDLMKPSTIEFIQNQSMINTQGIVLMGPDLPIKQVTATITKKSKKMNLLRKSKSNADECLKKTDMNYNNTSKSWWFKVKKANTSPVNQIELTNESNKPTISSPPLSCQTPQQRVRVLPEINKLTLSEALNIARRQHLLPNREPKLILPHKPYCSPINSTGQANYGSSIASTTSSSTQSSAEYDTGVLNNSIKEESTYLTATSPVIENNNNHSLITMLDKINKLTIERLTFDLRIIIDEYKHNLPVARFQTLKSFLHQHQSSKILSNEAIYFVLLQIIDEYSHHSTDSLKIITIDHFLIAHDSTIPIIVTTTSSVTNEDQSLEKFIKNLSNQLFDSSSLPIFNDLLTFENISYRYLSKQILQFSNVDIDHNISMQRVKLLDLFWNKIHSLRNIQINEENERFIFAHYHLMRHICQSDSLI
ncbi:unnamed protein product [Adineta steineri]|uniref:Serine/threonine-protein kinase 11-interacting protein n=2 Tax=Adineta steineri TaxID=433720 RepID=A0A814A5C0_9BILA|nr:unnamed protein product [Adineta steineri]CAF1353471.1 unnamed protein product [Adineta steineri]